MCAPSWDSGAVFAALIGGRGGYAVTPAQQFVWGGYYEDSSLIWRSRWTTHNGAVECREALAFPGDSHRAVLLRRILGSDGVRTTVLPDDDTDDEHPWEWLALLLRAHGIDLSVEELRPLPYDIVFSQRLRKPGSRRRGRRGDTC